ncbi:unnamed protein product [Leptosia nina]|uniref:ATP synthase subunit d, mitochondrial n=1 Tax=Leptosia nina TaxID=320188 RepID=A0AAV1J734_9NEOP
MAKRISQSSVNWAALAERVPPNQKSNLSAFKMKSDAYLRRVLANPAEAPKINWNQYKAAITIPGMVENFQKQYEALKIPYPADTLTSQIDAQWVQIQKEIEAYVKESNANIEGYEKKIAETKALLPFDQMTMEDFRDAYPDMALDPINKPTFWPHGPEDQIDYVDPEANKQAPAH